MGYLRRAVEVRLGGTVTDRYVKHIKWFERTCGSQVLDRLIVNTGPIAYRRPDGIGVIPLALLGPRARQRGLEPPTPALGERCSIH